MAKNDFVFFNNEMFKMTTPLGTDLGPARIPDPRIRGPGIRDPGSAKALK